jgi:hypothetical protein
VKQVFLFLFFCSHILAGSYQLNGITIMEEIQSSNVEYHRDSNGVLVQELYITGADTLKQIDYIYLSDSLSLTIGVYQNDTLFLDSVFQNDSVKIIKRFQQSLLTYTDSIFINRSVRWAQGKQLFARKFFQNTVQKDSLFENGILTQFSECQVNIQQISSCQKTLVRLDRNFIMENQILEKKAEGLFSLLTYEGESQNVILRQEDITLDDHNNISQSIIKEWSANTVQMDFSYSLTNTLPFFDLWNDTLSAADEGFWLYPRDQDGDSLITSVFGHEQDSTRHQDVFFKFDKMSLSTGWNVLNVSLSDGFETINKDLFVFKDQQTNIQIAKDMDLLLNYNTKKYVENIEHLQVYNSNGFLMFQYPNIKKLTPGKYFILGKLKNKTTSKQILWVKE